MCHRMPGPDADQGHLVPKGQRGGTRSETEEGQEASGGTADVF